MTELQQLCEKFGLSTEGLKFELTKQISDFISIKKPVHIDISPDVSRVCYLKMRVIPPCTSDQSVQPNHASMESSFDDRSIEPIPTSTQSTQTEIHKKKFNSLFFKIVFAFMMILIAIGVLGGCISIFQQFGNVEIIEVPVKRSWFLSNT